MFTNKHNWFSPSCREFSGMIHWLTINHSQHPPATHPATLRLARTKKITISEFPLSNLKREKNRDCRCSRTSLYCRSLAFGVPTYLKPWTWMKWNVAVQ